MIYILQNYSSVRIAFNVIKKRHTEYNTYVSESPLSFNHCFTMS